MIQDFINNDVICQLAVKPYWTVNIDGKKPLDIVAYDTMKVIRGAQNESCLTDLNNLLRIVNAIPQQFVYSLNAPRDGFVVLDIEKTCPDEIKDRLLDLPFLYGDISMSGKGCHLVFPCPPLDEVTINKVAMKEEHGYYEVLIHHFVTFTNFTMLPRYDASNAPIQFQQIWDELKSTQRLATKTEMEFDIDSVKLDFPQYDILKDAIIRNFKQRFRKRPDDYGGDMSRYEFAVIGSVRVSTNLILDVPVFARKIKLDEMQKIMLVYQIVTEILEPREKHNEIRDGKPMLLYQTCNSFVTNYQSETK